MEVLTQEQAILFKVYEGIAWHFLQENSKGSLPLLWLLSKPKPQETPQINVKKYFRVFSVHFMKIVIKDLLLENFVMWRVFCMCLMCIPASVVCVYWRWLTGQFLVLVQLGMIHGLSLKLKWSSSHIVTGLSYLA